MKKTPKMIASTIFKKDETDWLTVDKTKENGYGLYELDT